MLWGQIKTLFILCFLILDIILLQHYINDPIDTLEDLQVNVKNNVSGLEHIPEEFPAEAEMLFAQRREFSNAEKEEISSLSKQRNLIIEDHLIISQLDDPLKIDIDENAKALSEYVWHFDDYKYFGKDEATNTYIFFQSLERPVYFNSSGVLLVQVNNNGEATHYVQTLLEKSKNAPQSEAEEINTPIEALNGLYSSSNSYIVSGDEVTEDVELGYHNLAPLPNSVQVLAPTWGFVVNDDKYYYVNAVEGHLTSRNTSDFISEMKTQINQYFSADSKTVMQVSDKDWEQKDIMNFIQQLFVKTEDTNGVE
ncbi:two-component system regulatory protein YycI [Gracilibacillus caseinilyticus]|uniref:Two-component system regulatory protein YycI n=1 Tax=Gracilibacillus caseinilyticus TaxID=2932256 RepID=A0ABY4F097_9BACI|nr:two-component system regulatory protein YycI [Gracilibacillus caseinilyticus]UOQ49602.1 two-component system regulatory protein YycI [Gracilibacillus caseinilyticus]